MHLLLPPGATLSQPQPPPSLPELTINPCVGTASRAGQQPVCTLSWEVATQSNCGKGPGWAQTCCWALIALPHKAPEPFQSPLFGVSADAGRVGPGTGQ